MIALLESEGAPAGAVDYCYGQWDLFFRDRHAANPLRSRQYVVQRCCATYCSGSAMGETLTFFFLSISSADRRTTAERPAERGQGCLYRSSSRTSIDISRTARLARSGSALDSLYLPPHQREYPYAVPPYCFAGMSYLSGRKYNSRLSFKINTKRLLHFRSLRVLRRTFTVTVNRYIIPPRNARTGTISLAFCLSVVLRSSSSLLSSPWCVMVMFQLVVRRHTNVEPCA